MEQLKIRSKLLRADQIHNFAMLRAVLLCFFGFFRAGEITVPTEAAFNAQIHLAWAVDQVTPSTMVLVHLKQSQCDQSGKGVDVYIGCTGTDIYPVQKVMKYVTLRGPARGAFFWSQTSAPLTKVVFVLWVQKALKSLGKDSQTYAGHSFRIRADTAAAQAALEDTMIQSLSRRSSDTFCRYIRMQRKHLTMYLRDLASGATASGH